MGPIRAALLKYPLLAIAIGLAALALRLAVPAGFMPVLDQGRPALAPCPGGGPVLAAAHGSASSEPGTAHHDEGGPKAENSCAFADLALPAIGGAGFVLLAAALAFIMAAGLFLPAALPPGAALRLRPPLRGPPLPA